MRPLVIRQIALIPQVITIVFRSVLKRPHRPLLGESDHLLLIQKIQPIQEVSKRTLSVTIFEASAGGLFIPAEASVRPGNFISMPNQAVDIHGNISIPYAGNIRAAGRTAVEVQQAIIDALKNRAIEPQAVVSLVDQRTSLITVLGAGRSARVPAQATPERLLDVISRAGGITGGAAGQAVGG